MLSKKCKQIELMIIDENCTELETRINLLIGDLVQVVVVHDDTHGLTEHAEDAPKQHVSDPGTIKPLVNSFCDSHQRRLRQHSEESVQSEVAERSRDNDLMEGCREGKDEEHGHVSTEAHSQTGVVCRNKNTAKKERN